MYERVCKRMWEGVCERVCERVCEGCVLCEWCVRGEGGV